MGNQNAIPKDLVVLFALNFSVLPQDVLNLASTCKRLSGIIYPTKNKETESYYAKLHTHFLMSFIITKVRIGGAYQTAYVTMQINDPATQMIEYKVGKMNNEDWRNFDKTNKAIVMEQVLKTGVMLSTYQVNQKGQRQGKEVVYRSDTKRKHIERNWVVKDGERLPKQEGEQTEWDEDGHLKTRSKFVDGKEMEITQWYSSGDMERQATRKKDGTWKVKEFESLTQQYRSPLIKLTFKIIGDIGVGKTHMLMSYMYNMWTLPEAGPLDFEGAQTNVMYNGIPFQISMWEEDELLLMDGNRFGPVPNPDVLILCFSLADPDTATSLSTKWMDDLSQFRETPIVIAGLKQDLINDTETLQRLKASGKHPVVAAEMEPFLRKLREGKRENSVVYVENSALTQRGLLHTMDEAIRLAAESRQPSADRNKACLLS